MGIIKIRLVRKTKKEHICYDCKEIVVAGKSGYYTSGKDSGQFYSRHHHITCFLDHSTKNGIKIPPELMSEEQSVEI